MTVDDLIELLRLTPGHTQVVIDTTKVSPTEAPPDKPKPPPDEADTLPVVSVVGDTHDSPTIISANLIASPPPPPPAPLDPGQPGQLSPPPTAEEPPPEPTEPVGEPLLS